MGLHIMSYRANMIGGTLEVDRGSDGGTVVCCTFPLAICESEETMMTVTDRCSDRDESDGSSSSTITRSCARVWRMLINREPDLMVCGEAEEASGALQRDRQLAGPTS